MKNSSGSWTLFGSRRSILSDSNVRGLIFRFSVSDIVCLLHSPKWQVENSQMTYQMFRFIHRIGDLKEIAEKSPTTSHMKIILMYVILNGLSINDYYRVFIDSNNDFDHQNYRIKASADSFNTDLFISAIHTFQINLSWRNWQRRVQQRQSLPV